MQKKSIIVKLFKQTLRYMKNVQKKKGIGGNTKRDNNIEDQKQLYTYN